MSIRCCRLLIGSLLVALPLGSQATVDLRPSHPASDRVNACWHSQHPFQRAEPNGFSVAKYTKTKCIYTCVPPPLTVDGRNQCGMVCDR